MSRLFVLVLAGAALGAGATARAQAFPNINAPKQAAQRAANAANAQLSAQTGQAMPTRSGPTAALAPAPAAPPTPAPASTGTAVAPAGATRVVGTAAAAMPNNRLPQQVTREIFLYDQAGRRDPFFSLILTEDLRPLLTDLKLVGVLYEPSGRRSVAIFRDVQTNAQYRVLPGMTLGRMRVAQIKQRGVIFTIDEFGLSRQDSLMLSDSTKVRN
ncbi:MAG TPA: hypothetical protein VGG84_11885 [Gemmatimonadaceae bacterium]